MSQSSVSKKATCFHCGEDCGNHPVAAHDLMFCCEGCKMVYEILNKNGLCDYYNIAANPGLSRKIKVRDDKFAFLDDEKIKHSLVSFNDEKQTHITFYLPQMHCSSCLWLLENLHKLDAGILYSKVNFTRKEASLVFNHHEVSLRQVAELLTSIGYEPYISFNDMNRAKPRLNRSRVYKLGVAGFCFANIMLFSFPEYLGIDAKEQGMLSSFRMLNLLLSLPVFFYSASEFYASAWKGIKHKFLNIDAPIVLAIWVTFFRSIFEVVTNTGGGYFDSMSGIVFFMLIGRVLQDKTHQQLSFDRDYTAYFPIAVTRIQQGKETVATLPDIQLDDTLLIHNQELIPADGILTRGSAMIDYSFVTGESMPVRKEMGEMVYAGGKQEGGNIEILVIKEVSQSYLTSLWNRAGWKSETEDERKSFVHLVSRYFTWVVFSIALFTALYWLANDVTKAWNSVTAVLIIACPCALLLANTFTNGNILGILSRNQLYLRNAQTIEDIAAANHIVFDKTGTLTTNAKQDISYTGSSLSEKQQCQVASLVVHSAHPMSKAVCSFLNIRTVYAVKAFSEVPGSGIEGFVEDDLITIGSKRFVSGEDSWDDETAVYIAIEGMVYGKFVFANHYRENVFTMISEVQKKASVSVLSGDSAGEQKYLQQRLGTGTDIRFKQMPHDKLEAIERFQHSGSRVMMLGDGLNDAGALQRATVGIAISEHSNNFTPASDAILSADKLPLLHTFIQLCKANKQIVVASFIISILYNIIGIFFAVSGHLAPVVAAILMPASSISIVLITFGFSRLAAYRLGLSVSSKK